MAEADNPTGAAPRGLQQSSPYSGQGQAVDRKRPELGQLTLEQLARLVQKLERLVDAQRTELERLRQENERLRREGHRQAAPFQRRQRKDKPKRPGRKPGEGHFTRREPPSAEEVTEHVDVALPGGCSCGGELEYLRHEDASNTDLPPEPRPEARRYRIPVCRCLRCGKTVRGRHPDVAPDQFGATAHRVGDRAMAAAHALHYGIGVPQQQVPRILQELCGLTITQSAIAQDGMRRAERDLAQEYQDLRATIPLRAVVHTDDTGWRVGGGPAQMMAFATGEGESVYQIRPQHRNEEVREVLPAGYDGTMVTDRGPAYDAKEYDGVKQQKCMSHVQRSVNEVLEQKVGPARHLGERLKEELKQGQELWRDHRAGKVSDERFRAEAKLIQVEVSDLLRPRSMRDPDNDRLVNELGWHDDRGNLTRFLSDPAVPPTNNLAEREIRPSVKARKVSGCSKNWRGAWARECHLSIIRTTQRKTKGSLVDALHQKYIAAKMLLRGTSP